MCNETGCIIPIAGKVFKDKAILYYAFMKTDLNLTGLPVLGQENNYFKPTGSTKIAKGAGRLQAVW